MKSDNKGLIALSLLAYGLLSSCSFGGSKGDVASINRNPGTLAASPFEISIFTYQLTPEILPQDNPVLLEIEKRTNTKLNLIWVPSNIVTEKTKLTLASGDIPDLMLVGDPFDPQVKQLMDQGEFWDIAPYIKDYGNLSAISPEIWSLLKMKGKLYSIPRVRPFDGGGNMPMVRKDWLDKLGMKVPETVDDLYLVAKAFTENDPDGNGIADTIGITGHVTLDNMGNLNWVEEVFNGTKGNWKLGGGKLIPTVLEPETKDALLWLNKLYAEKLLVQDFAVLKYSQTRDLLMSGKAGIIGTAINPQWLFTDAIRKSDPDGDMYPLPYMKTPGGEKFAPKNAGFNGAYLIPKSVSEEHMRRLLSFMDYGASEEGSDLANFGIEGLHYEVQNGFKTATSQAGKDMVGQNVLGNLFSKFDNYQSAFLTGIPHELYERNKQVIDERSRVSVADPSVGLISETYMRVGKEYDKKIQDLKIKVIMGQVPISAWEEFVDDLRADTQFIQIVEELNESYLLNRDHSL